MTSLLKPIKVWGKGGPNPPKVSFILRELGLPHEFVPIGFADVKKPEFTAVNPNGRLPAIHDPNTDLTLWESGAIVEYLIERYDKDHKLSFPAGSKEAYLAKQWLFYQVTGQGPYYGQAIWFTRFHPEQLPSAKERYINEILRVTGVLEKYLSEQPAGADGPWLVGGRISYADLAFVPWQRATATFSDAYKPENFPFVEAWLKKMNARPSVAETFANADH